MPLRTQIDGRARAFARRSAAEICPQEHHAHSPTRRSVERQAFCRTQMDIQTFQTNPLRNYSNRLRRVIELPLNTVVRKRLDRGAVGYHPSKMASRCLRLLLVLAALGGSAPAATRAAYAEVASASVTLPVVAVASRSRAVSSRRCRGYAQAIPTRSPSRPRSFPRSPRSPRYLLHRALLL